ncbi:cytochrome P450 [Clohesyomyces aquaticus]|uniref:Cytochrome P450 n=1 Tax=Clohesyomyces aquaticus TaxID=1231657 RepID=A0A1Y1YJX4_9PLEO|nr:cytochrome P450 [Clohesyomyces aquaticus]
MSTKPPPHLPHGVSTRLLSGLTETFSFHASPETFISSRLTALASQHPELVDSRTTVRAQILNRNVAIVSSYSQVQAVLKYNGEDGGNEGKKCPVFVAEDAYKQFMGPFYPSPNLLLADGEAHVKMRGPWEAKMRGLFAKPGVAQMVKEQILRHFDETPTVPVDLYVHLKVLCWRILLGIFLDLRADDPIFAQFEKLQEDLLRGQFSLLPVSINVGVWHSPRKRGMDSKVKLHSMILERLKKVPGSCPFTPQDVQPLDDGLSEIANHILLFTSSLAIKGVSSLLTAYLLNVFLFQRGGVPLVDETTALASDEKTALLRSILLETERLSPPVVGIMRRATRETLLPTEDSLPEIKIPKGWDIWLYFVGAGRDPQVFGKKSDRFVPERYLTSEKAPEGFSFSTGSKTCIGKDLVRDICLAVATTMIESGVRLEGEVQAPGVRKWLGWSDDDEVSLEDWGRDVKQLPTQHPSKPVMVRVVSERRDSEDEGS